MEGLALKCPFCCEQSFDSKDALADHIAHYEENIHCPICESKYQSLGSLAEHLRNNDCSPNLTLFEVSESRQDHSYIQNFSQVTIARDPDHSYSHAEDESILLSPKLEHNPLDETQLSIKNNRNKYCRKYSPILLKKALQEYNLTDQSLMTISKKYGIPKSVLHRHNNYAMKQQGGQTALSQEEEEYLIGYINIASEWGYPLETMDFRLFIKGHLDKLGVEVKKFKNNIPGPDFVKAFLQRHHAKINSKLYQNIQIPRPAMTSEIFEDFFSKLEITLHGILPSNIVNYDETNITDDPGRKRILVKRSVRHPERIMNHSKGCISIMMAAAADGTPLNPYVVYKAQMMCDTWRQKGPKGCRYNNTLSGWFDSATFEDWVRTVVLPYFSDKVGTKILIGDNHVCHLSIELIKDCFENDIRFVFLPDKSINLTQPLTVAFHGPFQDAWREILFTWKNTNGRMQTTIPKNVFPSLLENVMAKIDYTNSQNILYGFKNSGISPLNKNKILDILPSFTSTRDTNSKELIDETSFSVSRMSEENITVEKSGKIDVEQLITDNKRKQNKQNCLEFVEPKVKTESKTYCKKKKIDAVAGMSLEKLH